MAYSRQEALLFRRWMPEQRAARLIRHPRFRFHSVTDVGVSRHPVVAPTALEGLKSWAYDGADIGMGVASSLISRTGNSMFDPSNNQGMVADALSGSVAVYEYTLELLSSRRPDLLHVFNGRLCHPRAILRAAQKLGVAVRIHDRGASKDQFVSRSFVPHDRKAIQRELLATWDIAGPDRMEQAREWFVERRNGKPKDWWSFTSGQHQGLLPSLPSGKRIVTYFSSSDDEFAALGDLYRWENWPDQMAAVTDLVRAAEDISDMQLVIRLHPHLLRKHREDVDRWIATSRRGNVAIVIEPGSPIDSYALLEASDVVVTGGSTIGMEAVYWGRPSVLMGPSDYDDLGAVHIARDLAALKRLLVQSHLEVKPERALPYGYYRGTFGEKFQFYTAKTLTDGEFLGVDLQRLPFGPRLVNRAKEHVLYTWRTSLRPRLPSRKVAMR